MKDLIKKQEEEFDAHFEWSNAEGITYHETDSNIKFDEKITDLHKLKDFIKKARKETAEAVAEKMIGEISDLRKEETGDAGETIWNDGYDERIKEEKEIKKQIIEIYEQ